MHYKFSKFAHKVIIINVILTVLVLLIHFYNLNSIMQTNAKIHRVIDEKMLSREEAIEYLQECGEDLFLGDEFYTLFGILSSCAALLFSYLFARSHNYVYGSLAALTSLLTTFLGGLLLFYLMFSGRAGDANYAEKIADRVPKSDWEAFLHNRNKKD